MSHQRERGFLPALRPAERLHNLVKSAPNLDNKSRSSTSTSTDNILGNSVDHCDSSPAGADSENVHHYTNTNYHSIYYERDLAKAGDDSQVHRKVSTASSHEQSNESHDYDSENSEHSVSVGCFSFVGNSSSSESKKKYKKLPKVYASDLDNRQLLPSQHDKKHPKGSDPKKKIQFEEFPAPKAEINIDMTFYKRFEQSLDAVGSHELDEQDYIYIRTKRNKTNLSVRLQKSLDAIDSYEIDESETPEKIYSKSIDDLSTGGDFEFHRNGSQFTWECFLKDGGRRNGYEARARESESSQESSRKVPWSEKQY